MNEEQIAAIESVIDAANISAIGEAVEYDSECSAAEREFADNAADHMRTLIAEVRRLGRELAKEKELRKVEGDRLAGEVSDLRRQVGDLEELLRREEARG